MKLSIKRNLWLFMMSLSACASTPLTATNVIRAAIEIGSGGPKLQVARVDLTANKIVQVFHIKQYPVIFQQDLSRSGNRTLSAEKMLQGLNAINDAIASAKSFGADAIAIIGTSVFRNAANGGQFADTIHSETGLKVHVLDQELEGKLAFQAALSTMDIDAEDLLVWDIGGGSTQWIGATADGSHLVDGSNEGSGPFRDFIIESIQGQSVKEYKSPNPLSHEQAALAEAHAHDLSTKVDQVFREKLRKPTIEIVGVGSVFGRGIAPLMAGKNPFAIEDLTIVVNELVGKTDADLGGGDFACIEVSNALLVLGCMKGLAIERMKIIDVNNTDGALVYKPFW